MIREFTVLLSDDSSGLVSFGVDEEVMLESNCSLARAMDSRIMRCIIISSCQSAATSEIVKRS